MKGLLGGLKGRLRGLMGRETKAPATPPLEPGLVQAYVVLAELRMPRASEMVAYVATQWPAAKPLIVHREDATSIIFDAGEKSTTLIMMFNWPIPAEALEYPAATAYGWPTARQDLAAGRGHLAIGTGGDRTTLEKHMLVTMLVQAACHLSGGIGVYWGNAHSVWPADFFAKVALRMTPDFLPVVLWTGLKIERHEDGTGSCFTRGMPPLGFMNVEIQRARRPLNEAIQLMVETSHYLITSGSAIKDGDTIGPPDGEKNRVTYKPSIIGSGETVYSIEY